MTLKPVAYTVGQCNKEAVVDNLYVCTIANDHVIFRHRVYKNLAYELRGGWRGVKTHVLQGTRKGRRWQWREYSVATPEFIKALTILAWPEWSPDDDMGR